MTELYRVPRLQIPAEVLLVGQSPRRLDIFLGVCAQSHAGYERPSDLLNGADAFVPALDTDGHMHILNKDAVQVLSVAAEYEFGEEDLVAIEVARLQATSKHVEIVLEGDTHLSGQLTYLLPEGQRRVQSFLNLKDRFFVLIEGDTVRLINKMHVQWVTEI
jgi:hypothetical protein